MAIKWNIVFSFAAWRIILYTNYLGLKMWLWQILCLTALLPCSHFSPPVVSLLLGCRATSMTHFHVSIFFPLYSCRNCSRTCPMICWKTAETPPQSWNTPPAAIKTLAAGNKRMETNTNSKLISHEGQMDSTLFSAPNTPDHSVMTMFLFATQPSISVDSAVASSTKTGFP